VPLVPHLSPCPPAEFSLAANFLLLLLLPGTPHGYSGPFREGFLGEGGCCQARMEKRQRQQRRRRQRHPDRRRSMSLFLSRPSVFLHLSSDSPVATYLTRAYTHTCAHTCVTYVLVTRSRVPTTARLASRPSRHHGGALLLEIRWHIWTRQSALSAIYVGIIRRGNVGRARARALTPHEFRASERGVANCSSSLAFPRG